MKLVDIDLKRIQKFLFEARQLRDIVGANILLGETLRCELYNVALAAPGRLELDELPSNIPAQNPNDPIQTDDPVLDDNPERLYANGVLARDGGHFRVIFRTEPDAENFRSAAVSLIRNSLPSLKFEIKLEDLEERFIDNRAREAAGSQENDERKPRFVKVDAHSEPGAVLVDHPSFQFCRAIGQGRASVKWQGVKDEAELPISTTVQRRRSAYKRMRESERRDSHSIPKDPPNDILGLIDRRSDADPRTRADDFETLCAGDYLAVIHADGNDVGKHAKASGKVRYPTSLEEFLAEEARFEAFFHQTRVAMRRAVVRAVTETFPAPSDAENSVGSVRPYQLMMLGGDDLLMVCQAKRAMAFVIALSRALKEIRPALTLGVGVSIASPKVPFHHQHDLAETLAGSAKRLYRHLARSEVPASVMDWHVETGSWTSDPLGQRRRNWMRSTKIGDETEELVLSQRPLMILDDGGTGASLERTLDAATRANRLIADGRLARSQLRRLVDGLGEGRRWSNYLLDGVRNSTRELLLKSDGGGIELGKIWQEVQENRWSTALMDIVSLAEIDRLEATPSKSAGATRADDREIGA